MDFQPVRTRRTFEAVVEQVLYGIRVGELKVGDRLPSERVLAEQLHVSRPTLREALRVLADVGVVQIEPGAVGGTFIASTVVPAALVRGREQMRISEIANVLEARRILEPGVAHLAAISATPADLERLEEVIALQRSCPHEQQESFIQLDMRFHRAIAEATHNAFLVEQIDDLLESLWIARDVALKGPHDPAHAIATHEETLLAIRSGDPDAVAAAMDVHLGALERIWDDSGRPRLRRIAARPLT